MLIMSPNNNLFIRYITLLENLKYELLTDPINPAILFSPMSWLLQGIGTNTPAPAPCPHCNKPHRTSPSRCWYSVCTTCGTQGHAFCCPHCSCKDTRHIPDKCKRAYCTHCEKLGHTITICSAYQKYLEILSKP